MAAHRACMWQTKTCCIQGGCSAPPALCFWAGLHLAAHTLCSIPATRRTAQLQGVSEEAYASVVVAHLQERLAGSAGSGFDELILGPALAYATSVPLQFLELALPPGVSGGRAGGAGCAAVGLLAAAAERRGPALLLLLWPTPCSQRAGHALCRRRARPLRASGRRG